MAVNLSPVGGVAAQFFDNNGVILSGGNLYTYLAGTTTPATTYTSSNGGTALTNPIVLDSAGRVPSGEIWLTNGINYKFVLKTSADVLISTWDNIPSINDFSSFSASDGSSLIGYQPAGTGAVATTVQAKLRQTVSVIDFGADPTGTIDSSSAIQSAINYCMNTGATTIYYPQGSYLLQTCLNCTSDSTHNRNSISHIALGGRRSVQFLCSTGGWAVDLSGSSWTKWSGIFFYRNNINVSYGAVLLASTSYSECLYNTFNDCAVDLYNASAPALFGTIGFCSVGSEENTWNALQVAANSPLILTTSYATISASYPSPYQNALINASHSCGVNTFAGQTSFVTWDRTNPPVYLYGANSTSFQNLYTGNINISASPGTNQYLIYASTTLEGFTAQIKTEAHSTILYIPAGSQIYGWKLNAQYGGGTSAAYPVISVATPSVGAQTLIENIDVTVSYYDPTIADFAAKKVVLAPGVSGATGNQISTLSNWRVKVNQTQAQAGVPLWDAQFCGTAVNCTMELVDCSYTINKNRHIKQLSGSKDIGPGDGSVPTNIGTIYLPPITTGFSARSITVRVSGQISSLNPSAGASDVNVTCGYFDTLKGAYSINDGTIVVGANGSSDNMLNTTTVTSVSSNAGLFLYTGLLLNMTYSSGARTISLIATPTATGSSLSSLEAFANDIKIEMITSGRMQQLIYLT